MSGKIAILLATYNRAKLIGATLDSIIAQSYESWECIIIDDFSTDNTQEVVQEYIEIDPRFFYLPKSKEVNKGLSASRNYGLNFSKNINPDYIQFFDDDDLMHPQKLELQVKKLNSNPIAKFCLCGALNFKEIDEIKWSEKKQLNYKKKYSLGEAYLKGDIRFVAQVPLFRFDYAKAFHFDEDLFYAEEWTLFSMQFLLNKPKYVKLDDVLFYRRKHDNSITEGKDVNYQKRKTSAVTGIKIVNFLDKHNCHTRVTLLYFIRQFLIYRYDSEILLSLERQLKNHPNVTKVDIFKYVQARQIHFMSRKIILKLLNF